MTTVTGGGLTPADLPYQMRIATASVASPTAGQVLASITAASGKALMAPHAVIDVGAATVGTETARFKFTYSDASTDAVDIDLNDGDPMTGVLLAAGSVSWDDGGAKLAVSLRTAVSDGKAITKVEVMSVNAITAGTWTVTVAAWEVSRP